MSTFLELAQAVARESGTISGTQPTTVTGQVGRLAKIVYWTNTAWRQIQNMHGEWRWMRGEFTSSALTAGAARYTATSFAITRFAEWIVDRDGDSGAITMYDNDVGVSDEGPLYKISWEDWRKTYGRGEQDEQRPTHYAISPANEICVGPEPQLSTYIIKGEYRKTAQELSADADEPEMPARFHDLIVWRGLLLLAEHDEAEIALAVAKRREIELLDALRRDQLPRIVLPTDTLGITGPFA